MRRICRRICDVISLSRMRDSINDRIKKSEKMNECIKDEIKFNRLIYNFILPWKTIEQKKFSKAFRNAFGEEIGFFFSWINHYIYWLIFPSLFGLISLIIIEIFNIFSFSNNF